RKRAQAVAVVERQRGRDRRQQEIDDEKGQERIAPRVARDEDACNLDEKQDRRRQQQLAAEAGVVAQVRIAVQREERRREVFEIAACERQRLVADRERGVMQVGQDVEARREICGVVHEIERERTCRDGRGAAERQQLAPAAPVEAACESRDDVER